MMYHMMRVWWRERPRCARGSPPTKTKRRRTFRSGGARSFCLDPARSLRTNSSRVEAVRSTAPNQRSLAHTRSGQGLGLDNDHLLFRFLLRRSTSGVTSPQSEPNCHSGHPGAAQAFQPWASYEPGASGASVFLEVSTRGSGGATPRHYLLCAGAGRSGAANPYTNASPR